MDIFLNYKSPYFEKVQFLNIFALSCLGEGQGNFWTCEWATPSGGDILQKELAEFNPNAGQ